MHVLLNLMLLCNKTWFSKRRFTESVGNQRLSLRIQGRPTIKGKVQEKGNEKEKDVDKLPRASQKKDLGKAWWYRQFTHAAAESRAADFRLAHALLVMLLLLFRSLRLQCAEGYQAASRTLKSSRCGWRRKRES